MKILGEQGSYTVLFENAPSHSRDTQAVRKLVAKEGSLQTMKWESSCAEIKQVGDYYRIQNTVGLSDIGLLYSCKLALKKP